MNPKIFEFLSKYYQFSKKYVPLINFVLFIGMLLLKLPNVATFLIYFGLVIIHFIVLALIQKYCKKYVENQLKDSDIVNEVLKNVSEKNN